MHITLARPALLLSLLMVVFGSHVTHAATLVVANKAEATVSLLDLTSGQVVATLPAGSGPHEVGISPDGSRALVTNYGSRGAPGNSLTLIDIPGAAVLKNIELGEYSRPHGVEWLDGTRAAVTAEDNQALIIVDVDEGKVIQTIGTDQDVSHMVALAPGGRRAYIANIGSGSVTVVDLETAERVRNIPTGEGAEGITLSGDHLWVTNRAADSITVLDTGSFESVAEISAVGFPIRATATPTGQVLVTLAQAGQLLVYDADTREAIRTVAFDLESMDAEDRLFGDRFGGSSVPIGVVVNDTGETAFVAHANADVITEVDLSTGTVLRYLRAGREPDGMGFSGRTVQP